jgi:hypothetical protein
MVVQHWFKRNFARDILRVVVYGPNVDFEAWNEVSKMVADLLTHEKHNSSATSSAVQSTLHSIRFIVSNYQKNTILPPRLPAHAHLSELHMTDSSTKLTRIRID